MSSLPRPVTALPGVGPARAARLERLGLETVRDVVLFAPWRLERVGPRLSIAEARSAVGRKVGVAGRVDGFRLVRRGRGRSTLRVRLTDGEATIDAVFFNQPWLRERLEKGVELALYGPVTGGARPALTHPRLETDGRPLPEPGSLVPVYPATEGLSQDFLRSLCRRALEEEEGRFEEHLSHDVLARHDLPALPEAVREVHAPTNEASHLRARRRVAFEHVVALRARIAARRARGPGRARPVEVPDREHAALLARFPFRMTPSQEEVIAELRADLARSVPMRRLLQGEVGAGKTAVGLYAVLAVTEGGGQCAFLAPTEVLAEQHFDGTRELLAAAGVEARFLTGSLRPRARRAVVSDVADGTAQVVFGTHALFSADVSFARLDLAVVDEQQRFGVAQRRALFDKGEDVHALLMTATPIPRTLALTYYGDLDTSYLRERPPGRGRVETRVVGADERGRAAATAAAHLARGGRVFWIVPRIETGDAGPGVDEVVAELRALGLGAWGVERVHGAVPPDERSRRLARVRRGDAGLLVATTVIEVGLDVPEATLCVIDGAERFGLAQLHQLRGRVGRGERDAECLLLVSPSGQGRVSVLERTSDGFEIAEEDLRRRGMGDLAGLRQAGENLEGVGEFLDLLELELELEGGDRVG